MICYKGRKQDYILQAKVRGVMGVSFHVSQNCKEPRRSQLLNMLGAEILEEKKVRKRKESMAEA